MPRQKPVSWSRGFQRAYGTIAKYTNWDTVSKALNDIKGLINSERYKLDTVDTGSFVVNNGVYSVHLTAVAQGDGDSQRTGNSIFVRSLNVRGACQWNAAGAAVQNIRIMIVVDNQQISDTGVNTQAILTTQDPDSHLNPATVGRFQVLWSRKYGLWDVQRPEINFSKNFALRHHVRYNGTASTDIQKGGIYIVAVSDQASNGPIIAFNARLSYHDN